MSRSRLLTCMAHEPLALAAGGIGCINALVAAPASSAAFSIAKWSLAFAAITCFTNLWAVGMVGYRY
jgi:hypothetical protein